MKEVKRPTVAFIGVILFAAMLYVIMSYLQNNVLSASLIPDYIQMEKGVTGGNLWYKILWFFGDMTEPNFYKTYIGGIGLTVGGIIAHMLYKRKSKLQGISIAYGSGLWPWVFGGSAISLIISNLLYDGNLVNGWFPTFVPFVCVAAGTVLVYGGGWKNALTGAVFGAVFTTPISVIISTYFCVPFGLPGVIGSVSGMWIGLIICFEIFRLLPWMKLPQQEEVVEVVQRDETINVIKLPEDKHVKPNAFFIRRILADFSEPCFAGNEYVSLGIIVGTLITWALCPSMPIYGAGILAAVLFSQIVTGAVSMFVYWDKWMTRPWFPTFPSMVSVAPGLTLFYEGSITVAIIAAVLGGIICPPICDLVSRNIPKHWAGVVGTTFSMALGTFAVGAFLAVLNGVINL